MAEFDFSSVLIENFKLEAKPLRNTYAVGLKKSLSGFWLYESCHPLKWIRMDSSNASLKAASLVCLAVIHAFAIEL